ncbi:hypothetical protein H6G97_43250 [Nostoc flagelliforme FACHB-838]|uniref:Water stress protein n=1 Tax=Nostoc flagelliforme FACHB-838 TaxID=2692904 RepID=A0ABR8E401_9NOSO|nr:hypothetical protein [Nostoc flagelliforme]MBD2535811.1 hypothetical protein [Nostoc flagelliforme FACHB-838]
MVLYGYTIGDSDSNPNVAGTQFAVYRFPISPFGSTPQLVGRINAANIQNNDLEGLGTNPATGRVSAVNEARASGSTATIDPTIVRVNNVDQPFAPASASPTRSPSDSRRFGFDSGADFGRDISSTGTVLSTNVLYNISGNNTTSNGVPVGSSLYEITVPTTGGGVVTLVDQFGAATTTAQRQGTAPTNPGKFADGLAIDNLTPGRTRALASDFTNTDETTGDTTRNNLYKVDLLTGELSAPIVLRNSSGQPLNLNADSGLAFTNLSGSTQRLLALLETGQVYEITGFQDELSASGLSLGTATGVNGAGFATATLLGTVNLPSASTGAIDYEGFTIVNE